MDMFAAPRAGRVMNGKDDDVGEKNYLKKKGKAKQVLSVRSLLIRSVINGRHGNQRENVSLLCHIYNYYFDDDGDNGYVDDNDDVDGEKRENSIFIKKDIK